MAEPASTGGPPSDKPPTVYITVDLSPSAEAKAKTGTEHGGPEVSRTSVVWEPPDATDLARVLPGYTVSALIGSGGMGAVYRAKQKSLERQVALKVLSPELAERAPEFTERFNNEAGALAKLSHPSIVHLFDCGRTKDGQLYIAMELVEGRDVADRLAGKQPLPAEEALFIAITVCEALEHAHQRGVIHRDIKPANVMLDATGRVKITDFGLARIIQAAVPKERQTTSLLGTPRFTAPEALIPGAEVDGRADIFSVGVMLYQMLTGEVPRGPAPPPSELTPGIDPRFDAIVARAMAENPRDRYADATRLREALEALRPTPDPAGLPAATLLNLERVAAVPSAQISQPAPPQPELELPDYEELLIHPPERSSSLMPWLSTLVVIAIAGFWAWQQWKHPGDTTLTRSAPVAGPTPGAVRPPSASSPSPGALATSANTAAPSPTPPPAPSVAAPSAAVRSAPVMAQAPVPRSTISPEQLAETQRRIAQIRGDFDASAKEWQAGQDLKFNQLDAQYLRAVRNAIISMRNERRHADLAGLQEEEKLLLARAPLPPLDAASPPERVRLRGIYDGQVLQIARAGAETKIEIYNRLLGSLFAYQSILKQTNKQEAAEMVGGIIDLAVKERDALRASLNLPAGGSGKSGAGVRSDSVAETDFGVVYEAEDMKTQVSGGRAGWETGSVRGLSGNRQLVWRDGKLGDTIVLPFQTPRAGRCRLEAALIKAPGNGVFKFQLNGGFVGEPAYDLYAPGAPSVSWQTLHEGIVKAGRNELLARVLDTNRSGPRGYDFALDCLRLAPLE